MPVYNGENYLKEAIDSILNQTFSDFEFIVVNDGSRDSTSMILNTYAKLDNRIRIIINEKNLGIAKSLNIGLNLSRGNFIARQDADDISAQRRLKIQIDYLKKHPQIGLLGTACHLIDRNGKYVRTNCPETNDTAIHWRMLFRNAFVHTSVMIRREVLTKAHLFYSEKLLHNEDMGLWVQLMKYSKVANLKEPLVSLRRHDNSISMTQFKEQERVSTEISFNQLLRLLPDSSLSMEDVGILRKWHKQLPRQLRKEDFRLCRDYFHILNIFSGKSNIDPIVINAIRFSLWVRTIRAVPLKDYTNLISTPGILKSIMGQNIFFALAGMLKWFILYLEKRLHVEKKGFY